MTKQKDSIRWFAQLTNKDVALVGGKNASLGEMIGTLKVKARLSLDTGPPSVGF